MRAHLGVSLLLLAPACGHETERADPGPAPANAHQQEVQALQEQVFARAHPLDAASAYRFARPVEGRVARWHFEPEGETHTLGYVHGWCVEYWVTPRYAGYPKQPESHRMAFFASGRLRGLFLEGLGNAPLELDKWAPSWIDTAWRPTARAPEQARPGASPR